VLVLRVELVTVAQVAQVEEAVAEVTVPLVLVLQVAMAASFFTTDS
jgi:hypothetical protein